MKIRPATLHDAKLLLDWRNDPLTRAMSRNSDPVQWDTHVTWLTGRLARSNPQLYIATVDDHPVGTFRVDADEISYTVAPDSRGRGFCRAMLREAREMFGPLRAEIYEQNVASIKAAEQAGMLVCVLATPDIQRKEACWPPCRGN
jgi:RimJ/RimL family protein N-acetyltransferase